MNEWKNKMAEIRESTERWRIYIYIRCNLPIAKYCFLLQSGVWISLYPLPNIVFFYSQVCEFLLFKDFLHLNECFYLYISGGFKIFAKRYMYIYINLVRRNLENAFDYPLQHRNWPWWNKIRRFARLHPRRMELANILSEWLRIPGKETRTWTSRTNNTFHLK